LITKENMLEFAEGYETSEILTYQEDDEDYY
jgi:hypothetical protein